VYATYKQAAIQRGLLEDDTEWQRCLQEASLFMMPSQLRELFASILHESVPAHPIDLWNAFKGALSEEILHHLRRFYDPGSSPMPLIQPYMKLSLAS